MQHDYSGHHCPKVPTGLTGGFAIIVGMELRASRVAFGQVRLSTG